MQKDKLWEILNEYRTSGESISDIDSLVNFLSHKDNLAYDDIINIIFSLNRHNPSTPQIVSSFLASFAEAIKAHSVLDPFAKYGQVAFETSKYTESHIDAVSLDYTGHGIVKSFTPCNVTAHLGDILQLNFDNKYDLIISDFPFSAKTNYVFKGEMIKDLGLAMVARCIELVKDDGYIIATFANGITFRTDLLRTLKKMEDESMYVSGMIDLPSGAYAPFTNISCKLVIFEKKAVSKKFIAQLTSLKDIDAIISNFIIKKETKQSNLGMFVHPKDYIDYSAYQQKQNNERLAKLFGGQYTTLKELGTAYRPNSNNEFTDTGNSIFIPKIGVSKVVTSVNDFEIKPQNYIQVVLNQELILNRYAAYFFNIPKGIDIRRDYQQGGAIPNFSLSSILNIPIVLSDMNTQLNILETHQAVIELESQLNAIKNELYSTPMSYRKIKVRLKNINNEETLEDWVEKIPFPIASVLRRYITATEDKDRQKALLQFFEALSAFISALFLSFVKESKTALVGVSIITDIEIKSFEKATFGSWVTINSQYAKSFRELLAIKENRALIYRIFATKNTSVIERLCNKDLYVVLGEANRLRNIWEGHGGAYSNEHYRDHVETLHGILLKIRNILNDVFDEFQLVRGSKLSKKSGIFINTAELLIGSNNLFKSKSIESGTIALDEGKLYIHTREDNTVIELIPLLVMGSTPSSIKNACYFYSRTAGKATEYISYHYEENPETEVPGNSVLSELMNIMTDDYLDNSKVVGIIK